MGTRRSALGRHRRSGGADGGRAGHLPARRAHIVRCIRRMPRAGTGLGHFGRRQPAWALGPGAGRPGTGPGRAPGCQAARLFAPHLHFAAYFAATILPFQLLLYYYSIAARRDYLIAGFAHINPVSAQTPVRSALPQYSITALQRNKQSLTDNVTQYYGHKKSVCARVCARARRHCCRRRAYSLPRETLLFHAICPHSYLICRHTVTHLQSVTARNRPLPAPRTAILPISRRFHHAPVVSTPVKRCTGISARA